MKSRAFTILSALSRLLGVAVVVIIVATLASGCKRTGKTVNNASVVSSAEAKIPVVKQFTRHAPSPIHYVTQREDGLMLTSKAGYFGRYILTMQLKITVDKNGNEIEHWETPRFWLNEVHEIERLPGERFSIRYRDQVEFSEEDWREFLDEGDQSAVGKLMKRDNPVPHFADAWRQG
jgi:hypothetical protein